jgi:hypothetical protein
VKLEENVRGWDTTTLEGNDIFEISVHNNSIATKVMEDIEKKNATKLPFC